jgi:hypothetical protein
LQIISDWTPDNQLEVSVVGHIAVDGSRFVADNSLSILKKYRLSIGK